MATEIKYYNHSVQIVGSWRVNSKDGMNAWIHEMKSDLKCAPEVYYRSNGSLRREWEAHNLLFWHKYEVERTKDCDFNAESFCRRLAYSVLAAIFVLFERNKHKNPNEPRP